MKQLSSSLSVPYWFLANKFCTMCRHLRLFISQQVDFYCTYFRIDVIHSGALILPPPPANYIAFQFLKLESQKKSTTKFLY
jgi:hypothetical protein